MLASIFGILGIILILLIVRPVTTFVHELGHALPALIFTKKEVVIYIGSYGDTDKSIIWKTGRLTTLFRYKITDWQMGLCWHERSSRILHEMIIVLGGPLFSLILGLACYYLIRQYPENSFLTLALATVLVSGILDFLVNIIPQENPIELGNGKLVLNDGSQLKHLFRMSTYPPDYFEGLKLLEEGKQEAGVEKLKAVIDAGKKDIYLYRFVMDQFDEAPANAIAFNDQYYQQFKLQSPDFKKLGDQYTLINEPSFAIQCYTEAIRLNYKNQAALLERAKRYIHVGLEGKAMEDLKIVNLIEENAEAQGLMKKINS